MKNPHIYKVIRIMTILVIFFVPSLLFAGEVIVVANKSVPDSQLTKDDVKAIFLGEKTKWSNDTKIIFVLLKTPELHEKFIKDYIGKSPSQFDNFWKQQIFTGKGKMPETFNDEKVLLDYLVKTDGAIAYISSDITANNIKKIEIK